MSHRPHAEKDPVTELYDVASALRFLEEALETHDETETQVRAGGAAYVTGLMGRRLTDLASALWEMESRPPVAAAPCPPAPVADSAQARAQAAD
jgi:hypothetical protein